MDYKNGFIGVDHLRKPKATRGETLESIYAPVVIADLAIVAAIAIKREYESVRSYLPSDAEITAKLIRETYTAPAPVTPKPLACGDVLERADGTYAGSKWIVCHSGYSARIVSLDGHGDWKGEGVEVKDPNQISKHEARSMAGHCGLEGWVRLPKGSVTL